MTSDAMAVRNQAHSTGAPLTFGCTDWQCFNTSHGLLYSTDLRISVVPLSDAHFTTEWDKKPAGRVLKVQIHHARGEGAEF